MLSMGRNVVGKYGADCRDEWMYLFQLVLLGMVGEGLRMGVLLGSGVVDMETIQWLD